jgi:hypothetical protein
MHEEILLAPIFLSSFRVIPCNEDGLVMADVSLKCNSTEHIALITFSHPFSIALVFGVLYSFRYIWYSTITEVETDHSQYILRKDFEGKSGISSDWQEKHFFVFGDFMRSQIYYRPTMALLKLGLSLNNAFVFDVLVRVSLTVHCG